MAEAAYERLSALDAAFLQLEDRHAHMHVGGIIVMDATALTLPHGGIDFEHLRMHLEAAALQAPRLKQRIERVPGFGHPVWVEDPHFRLDYHVRHTALPRPGSMTELNRLAGRIFSQPLDHDRPLWEMWVVEGLDGQRFALIPKIHHCLMDGIGAMGLMTALAGARRTAAMPTEPPPAPKPTRSELWWGEVRHRLSGFQETVRSARDAVEKARDGSSGAADIARGLGDAFKSGLTQVTATPINPEKLGPHRRYETLRMNLKEIKAVKNQLGGTVNDVVLTILTGACRRYLARRGVHLAEVTRFRALVPANLRTDVSPAATQGLGNRVAFMLPALPIDENDPIKQHKRVCAETRHHKKESNELASTDFLEKLDDGLGLGLVAASFRLAIARRAFSLVATNVPGPPMSLNLFGAKLLGIYPLVPLFKHQALGVAIFSYDGGLYWGLNADWDAIPDLPILVTDIEESFAALKEAAQLVTGSAPQASATR